MKRDALTNKRSSLAVCNHPGTLRLIGGIAWSIISKPAQFPPRPTVWGRAMSEIWKEVPDYEGLYSVSDQGRVRRDVRRANWKAGGYLKPTVSGKGYLYVSLTSADGTRKTWRLHRLVSHTFDGPIPEAIEINHKNGVKGDNRRSNLERCSRSDNMIHASKHGLLDPPRGVEHHRTTLKPDDVRAIRKARGKATCKRLAERFGVGASTISRIQRREAWKHIR